MYDIISLSVEGSTDLSQYSISIRGAENWFKMQSGFSALHFKTILILSAGQNCRYQGKSRRRSEATLESVQRKWLHSDCDYDMCHSLVSLTGVST